MDALFVTRTLEKSVKQVCAVVDRLLGDRLAVKNSKTHNTELTVIVNSAGDKKPVMKTVVNQPGILLQHVHCLL